MAKMIDQKPDYKGEAKVWDALEAYLPDNVVVYNNREINGREFDYCLLIENCGALIIEVKGWLADKIKVQGVDLIEVEGYEKPQRSPKKQARAYRFALLNKIVATYNLSPLVFDMVCYPIISEQEYLNTHLDIISEKQFTIFKEDLDSQERLQEKIKSAYDATKGIPHADLTHDLMIQFRQAWEPNYEELVYREKIQVKPHSVLSVYYSQISNAEIEEIVSSYFYGIKRIVFLDDTVSYAAAISALDCAFKQHNIEPAGNNLKIGYQNGLKRGEYSTRAFNLEVYLIPHLAEYCPDGLSLEEGKLTPETENILKQLASKSTFNLEQYKVEHAPTEKNTLVEAGAGTGKTFSMVSRVAFLCNKKLNPVTNIADEIAMVTFTNDAANNMRTRLKQMFVNYFILTGDLRFLKFVEDIERAHISTIHSFTLDILRNESLYTGLGTNFRVTSDEYMRGKIYDRYLGEFLDGMEEENSNFIHEIPVPVYELKKKILGIADRLLAKSVNLKNIKPSELGETVENSLPYFNRILTQVIFPAEEEYLETVHLSNDMDLKECIILLEKVLDRIDGKIDILKIKYLFIDEFQDTDDVQIRVFQKLQKRMNAVCHLFVVGDLKQSIYRFRGARLSAFSQLKEEAMFEWEIVHLNINYRTDYRLLERYDPIFRNMGANQFLPYTVPEDCLFSSMLTQTDEENLFVEIPCHAKEEGAFFEAVFAAVKKQISLLQNLMQSDTLSKEERTIAILVRNNWQVDKLVTAGQEEGLKIETKSGGDLFQLASSQDLYKLVLALNNNSNPVYLINFIESNYTTLKLDYQRYSGMSTEERLNDLVRVLDEFFQVRMGKTWQELVEETYTCPVLYVIKQVYDALAPWKQYSRNSYEQTHYMVNYEYLIEKAIKFFYMNTPTLNQLTEFLRINIVTGQQQLSRETGIDDAGIHLLCTTIHKSKGLEYGTVVLPYTDEDISDIRKVKLDANYSKSKLAYTIQFENKVKEYNTHYSAEAESIEQISEESRILYVALTRAIRNCVWIKNLDRNPAISWGSLLEE